MAVKPFIAVHVGAGYHSYSKENDYKTACKRACVQAMALLENRKSALDAVVAAVMSLEDSTCTNAGCGSNMTLRGTVECDASAMDGKTLAHGAVGAISGVKNPVMVAQKLVEEQYKSLSLGRIPPSLLVGHGAHDWAVEQGVEEVPENKMVTESSLKTYKAHKRKLCRSGSMEEGKKLKNTEMSNNEDCIQDTVGAVCIDGDGNIASAMSSGGLSLKHPGRLGPAAIFGAGCWASNTQRDVPGCGVVSSGTGEHLMKTSLAKECFNCFKEKNSSLALGEVLQTKFLGSPLLKNVDNKYGGVLVLKHEASDRNEAELLWAYTTDSMCLGYQLLGEKPKAVVSRMPSNCSAGKSFTMEGKHFNL